MPSHLFTQHNETDLWMLVQTLYVNKNNLVSPLEPEWSGMAALKTLSAPPPPPPPRANPVVFACSST